MGMTFLYLLSSTPAASSGSCPFEWQLQHNAPHGPLLSPPAGTQMTPTATSDSRRSIYSRIPFACGLLRAIFSGIRVQSQAWKASSNKNLIALPLTTAKQGTLAAILLLSKASTQMLVLHPGKCVHLRLWQQL